MDEAIINAVFRPKSSKQEAKADITTRVARDIIDGEATARDAKTERLRAARLAREATAKPVSGAKKTRHTG